MTLNNNSFWDDLNEDLKDPDFRLAYTYEYIRLTNIDRIVNMLEGEDAG